MSRDTDTVLSVRRDGGAGTEVRVELPREVIDVADAESIAAGISRNQQIVLVLSEWAARRLHAASVLARMRGVQPPVSGPSGEARN